MKGYGRLSVSNRIYQTHFIFLLFFQPYVLFVSRLHGVRGRPSWPTEHRATQGAPAPTGYPGETGLTGPPYRSGRLMLRRCKERRCVLRDLARSCVGSDRRQQLSTTCADELNCLV